MRTVQPPFAVRRTDARAVGRCHRPLLALLLPCPQDGTRLVSGPGGQAQRRLGDRVGGCLSRRSTELESRSRWFIRRCRGCSVGESVAGTRSHGEPPLRSQMYGKYGVLGAVNDVGNLVSSAVVGWCGRPIDKVGIYRPLTRSLTKGDTLFLVGKNHRQRRPCEVFLRHSCWQWCRSA